MPLPPKDEDVRPKKEEDPPPVVPPLVGLALTHSPPVDGPAPDWEPDWGTSSLDEDPEEHGPFEEHSVCAPPLDPFARVDDTTHGGGAALFSGEAAKSSGGGGAALPSGEGAKSSGGAAPTSSGAATSSGGGGEGTKSGGEASTSTAVYSHGRVVHNPYSHRDDVGAYGIYVGNWSGRRKLQVVNNHIAADLVARNPAQVILAQEVDRDFVKTLGDPEGSKEATSAVHPVEGQTTPSVVGEGKGRNYGEREMDLRPWHVCAPTEGQSGLSQSTLIIAARSTLASSIATLDWQKIFHRDYKRKGKFHVAYSRLLTAQIVWHQPRHGYKTMQLLNVHLHHLVAKKDTSPN